MSDSEEFTYINVADPELEEFPEPVNCPLATLHKQQNTHQKLKQPTFL